MRVGTPNCLSSTVDKETMLIPKFTIEPSISMGHITVALVAFTYLIGYLILHTFSATIGLPSSGLLDAQYLEAGVFFEMVSLAIVAVPVILWLLLRGLYQPKDIPSEESGDGDNKSANEDPSKDIRLPLILVSNLCYAMLFFALFATKELLDITVNWYIWTPPLSFLFYSYLIGSVVAMLSLGIIRLALIEDGGPGQLARIVLKAIRVTLFIILIILAFIIDITLLFKIQVIGRIPFSAYLYLTLFILFLCVFSYGRMRIMQLQNSPSKGPMFVIVAYFSMMILYLSIITYALVLYPNMPENRGGKYPLTQVLFVFKDEYKSNYYEILDKSTQEGRSIPLFLMDARNDLLYCYQGWHPFETWYNRKMYVVKKGDIASMEISRNSFLKIP